MRDDAFFQPGDCESFQWYLVQLRPQGLKRARSNLQRQGFSLFCPMEQASHRRNGRIRSIWRALFPGYLFVGFDTTIAPWSKINSTYGVARLVTFGEADPRPVPNVLIKGMRARCDSQDRLRPPELLKSGDNVRIVNGPFSDLITRVEKISPDQRVWVLLDLLGRETSVALCTENLQIV